MKQSCEQLIRALENSCVLKQEDTNNLLLNRQHTLSKWSQCLLRRSPLIFHHPGPRLVLRRFFSNNSCNHRRNPAACDSRYCLLHFRLTKTTKKKRHFEKALYAAQGRKNYWGGKQNLKPTRSCGDFNQVPSSQDVKHKNKGNDSTLTGYTG